IGRGTSTFDGMSLAFACAEDLAQRLRAYTLFATHYFELTQLADECPGVRNAHLSATQQSDNIIFLHRVQEGPASKSYGLQVAQLAGVPRAVIASARARLARLEQAQDAHPSAPPISASGHNSPSQLPQQNDLFGAPS